MSTSLRSRTLSDRDLATIHQFLLSLPIANHPVLGEDIFVTDNANRPVTITFFRLLPSRRNNTNRESVEIRVYCMRPSRVLYTLSLLLLLVCVCTQANYSLASTRIQMNFCGEEIAPFSFILFAIKKKDVSYVPFTGAGMPRSSTFTEAGIVRHNTVRCAVRRCPRNFIAYNESVPS